MTTKHQFLLRNRSFSQGTLRRHRASSQSEERLGKELTKASTASSFRPKMERLIREGKIQQFLNTDPHSKANIFYANHVNEMEKELSSAKKSLSTFVLQSKSKQYSINKLKSDIAKIERESSIIQNEFDASSQKYSHHKDSLGQLKSNVEDHFWVEKTYIFKKKQLTKDEELLKTRYQQNEQLCDVLDIECKRLEAKYHDLVKTNADLRKFENQAHQILNHHTQEKNEFIKLLNEQKEERELLQELKADKVRKEGEINDLAVSLVEKEELEQYLHILYTHRLLDHILKTKNNKMLEKYGEVQEAYMYIKSNTNIINIDKILSRMEEQDQIYDNALKSVAKLEREVLNIEARIQDEAEQKNKILSMNGVPKIKPKDSYRGKQKDKYILLLSQKEKEEVKKIDDEVLKKQIEHWTAQRMDQLGIRGNDKLTCEENIATLVDEIKKRSKKEKKPK